MEGGATVAEHGGMRTQLLAATFLVMLLPAAPRGAAAAAYDRGSGEGHRDAVTATARQDNYMYPSDKIGRLGLVREGKRESVVLFEIRRRGRVVDLDSFSVHHKSGRAYRNGEGYRAMLVNASARAKAEYGERAQAIAAGLSVDGQRLRAEIWGVPGVRPTYEVALAPGFRVVGKTMKKLPAERTLEPLSAEAVAAMSDETKAQLRALWKAAGGR